MGRVISEGGRRVSSKIDHLVKIAHYQKELEQFRKGELVLPRRIQIDPVSVCNHDCAFCTYRYTRDADMNALFDLKDVIPLSRMLEIFDDCVDLGVKAIELTGGGEPSLHRDFPEILAELNCRDLEIGLITNGAWRKKQFFDVISGLWDAEWIRFSLDAATPKTHEITHGTRAGDFDRALLAIDALRDAPATVGLSFIVQKANQHEIEAFANLATRLGADYIRYGGVVFEGERIDHIELTGAEHGDVVKRIESLDCDVEVIDNFSERSCVEFARYKEGDTCFYSYLGLTIGADLRLYPCCVWKYRPAGVIADLNKAGLADALRSGALDKFYESFSIADKCSRCYLKDKNDFVASLLKLDVEHLNFV